jgi:hypothetical protein
VGANDKDHLTHIAKVLQLLAKNIESFSTGELWGLWLPETEMALITKCPGSSKLSWGIRVSQ